MPLLVEFEERIGTRGECKVVWVGREEERNCEDAGSVIWCYIYAARVGVELLDYFSFKVRLSDCLILLAGRVQRYR